MKILYLAHRIPYPPNKGDKIRSFNEIKYLSQNHSISLACLVDNNRDLKYVDDLKKYCATIDAVLINKTLAKLKTLFYLFTQKPLSLAYFYSKRLHMIIYYRLLATEYDLIFCFSSPMAQYVMNTTLLQPLTRDYKQLTQDHKPIKIMDFVDVDSDKWRQYTQYTGSLSSRIYLLEAERLQRYEIEITEHFHHSILVSSKEVEILRRFTPNSKVTAIPNGIDSQYFFSPNISNKLTIIDPSLSPAIIFTGAMDYFANIDGILYFHQEIFPLIKAEIPKAKLYIVGSNPPRKILRLGDGADVIVTGYVEDIRPYLASASISVVPLRIARGIQNKILEAMAMELPVVTTSLALEGIDATPGKELMVADDPSNFARLVIQLLGSKDMREQIGRNARRFVLEKHSWEKNLSFLEELLYILVNG
jgi:sugar transferase (PEP-CTERM/EpsH1 system associated)